LAKLVAALHNHNENQIRTQDLSLCPTYHFHHRFVLGNARLLTRASNIAICLSSAYLKKRALVRFPINLVVGDFEDTPRAKVEGGRGRLEIPLARGTQGAQHRGTEHACGELV
jgi:hypothetical protein